MNSFELVSHTLCPYVQRVAIALTERDVAFKRIYIKLEDKPAWFLALSPTGKVPLLRVDQDVLFESVPILEYLEDTSDSKLHPASTIQRARHRAWIEFGSGILDNIAGLYNAPNETVFNDRKDGLRKKFERLEDHLTEGPYFDRGQFSLVDAVFGPIFRYWEVFDAIHDFVMFHGLPKIAKWRVALAHRPSIRSAVEPEYASSLLDFLAAKQSYLGELARKHRLLPSVS